MKFAIQLLSAAVGALAVGSIVIFIMVDFPATARIAYAGREAEAFLPGEAGFIMVQLALQALAAFFCLFCLTKSVSTNVRTTCIAFVVLAAIISVIDIYWLPILAIVQCAAFVAYTLRSPANRVTA